MLLKLKRATWIKGDRRVSMNALGGRSGGSIHGWHTILTALSQADSRTVEDCGRVAIVADVDAPVSVAWPYPIRTCL